MASGVYKLLAAKDSVQRFLATNRPSTDALGVLARWRDASVGRTFDLLEDTDEHIVARLSWNDDDTKVGGDLGGLLLQRGLQAEYLSTRGSEVDQ